MSLTWWSSLQWGVGAPTTNGGAFGIYEIADPSYSPTDGGFAGYAQNMNSVTDAITMCHDADGVGGCRG